MTTIIDLIIDRLIHDQPAKVYIMSEPDDPDLDAGNEPCPDCDGTGTDPSDDEPCQYCGGTGTIR
jgi:RecJ-like exonuclease